jgi:hypothetical protein
MTMTDQQLLDAGERLYKAFLGSNFTFLELAGLAAARERRTPWADLGQNLKLAVFRLVVLSAPEKSEVSSTDPVAPRQPMDTEQAAPAVRGSNEEVATESALGRTAARTSTGSAPTPDPADDGQDPANGTAL